MGGKMAEGYSALLKAMWSGTAGSVHPSQFKYILSEYRVTLCELRSLSRGGVVCSVFRPCWSVWCCVVMLGVLCYDVWLFYSSVQWRGGFRVLFCVVEACIVSIHVGCP